jgi:Flp pilus assembly protein TadG
MKRQGEKGQTLVELALVLPVFLMLFFAILDGARLAMDYNTVAHAAREGARYAVVHGSTSTSPIGPGVNESNLTDYVNQYLDQLPAADLTVKPTWLTGTSGPGSKVKVNVTYTFLPAVGSLVGLSNVSFGSATTMVIVN